MGKVIRLRVKPITEATDEQLKREWKAWFESDAGDEDHVPGNIYDYKDIHAELNRRGLGEYCAV